MKQKWWKALPMLLMMAVLGSGSVRTWKNLAGKRAVLSRNDRSEHVFSDDIGQKCD